MRKNAFLGIFAVAWAGIVAWWVLSTSAPAPFDGEKMIVQLSRGPFAVLKFPPGNRAASAVILFASGDGGWGDLEEAVAHAFQDHGYEVIGIDSTTYAATDYDLNILQADFGRIAQAAENPYGQHPPPLIIGGYSMGAAQAIAVVGGPNPPSGTVGLLVMDPLSRGRYGLRTSDQLNVLPNGPGTFSMADFAKSIRNIRVVQWHAENDVIDSRAWLGSLVVAHREFDFPHAGHDYKDDREDFLRQLVESAGWLSQRNENRAMAAGG